MHTKFLLAAAAVLGSVGVAQAQDGRGVEILTPWEDREVDSSFDSGDTASYSAGQHVQSNATAPVPLNLTSKVSRADTSVVSHWQDAEVDSSFDAEEVARYGAATLIQSNVTSKGRLAGLDIVSRWEEREIDSSFDGNGND